MLGPRLTPLPDRKVTATTSCFRPGGGAVGAAPPFASLAPYASLNLSSTRFAWLGLISKSDVELTRSPNGELRLVRYVAVVRPRFSLVIGVQMWWIFLANLLTKILLNFLMNLSSNFWSWFNGKSGSERSDSESALS